MMGLGIEGVVAITDLTFGSRTGPTKMVVQQVVDLLESLRAMSDTNVAKAGAIRIVLFIFLKGIKGQSWNELTLPRCFRYHERLVWSTDLGRISNFHPL